MLRRSIATLLFAVPLLTNLAQTEPAPRPAAAPADKAAPADEAAPSAGPASTDRAQLAARFAQQLLQAESPQLASMGTAQIAELLTPERALTMRDQLRGQRGEILEVGDPWLDDEGSGMSRYRIPVRFDRGKLDLQVVIDAEGKVAGVFFAAPAERPGGPGPEDPPGGKAVAVKFGDPTPLPGVLETPDGEGPFPAVILVHGSGPNDRDGSVGPNTPLKDIAHGMIARGIAVLRYDKRSYAAPETLSSSAGTMTVEAEVIKDIWAGLDLLRTRPQIDANRLYIVGHSLGGTVAPRAAAREPHPAGVVTLAGLTEPLPNAIVRQTSYIAGLDGEVDDLERASLEELRADYERLRAMITGAAEWDPAATLLGIPADYYRDLAAHDPVAIAAETGVPILVAHGGRDYQVNAISLERWEKGLAGKPFACLRIYHQLDHLLREGEGPSTPASYMEPGKVSTTLIDEVAAWIQGGVCPGAEGPTH